MSHAAQGSHERLAEAMAAVIGSDLLKSHFNPTGVLSRAARAPKPTAAQCS
jgi:hypothetical protein